MSDEVRSYRDSRDMQAKQAAAQGWRESSTKSPMGGGGVIQQVEILTEAILDTEKAVMAVEERGQMVLRPEPPDDRGQAVATGVGETSRLAGVLMEQVRRVRGIESRLRLLADRVDL